MSVIVVYCMHRDTVSPTRVEIWKENKFLFFHLHTYYYVLFIVFIFHPPHIFEQKVDHDSIL